MDKSKAALATIGIMLAGAIGVAASATAAPSSDEQTSIQGTLALTPASIEQGGASFYDAETLALAWTATVDAFEEELPTGYHLVQELPAAFEQLGPGENLFQAQIIDMTVATNYRCTWLDAGFNGVATADQVGKALETYWTLPSVTDFDETGLDTNLKEISAELGYEDLDRVLFDLTCNGWEK